MCGICGWVGRSPDLVRLRHAQEQLRERGPDGAGHWVDEDVMLGHTRLRVIDLSESAGQPMPNETGSVRVVFNGEIYNFQALRKELAPWHRFQSSGDTEILVHGYEEWGIEGLLDRIRGMFAFALWDSEQEVLHLARDRLGKKPLYLMPSNGALVFASTVPALLALLDTEPPVSAQAVADYLIALATPGERSIFEGVYKLLPGHRAEFKGGSIRIQRFWRLSFAHQEDRPFEEWVELVDAEVGRAVRERLVADVPVGIFLSGGVDSSLVSSWAARHTSGPIRTISAGFVDDAFDERPYARRVAEHLGTNHTELVIEPDAAALLPRIVAAVGEPFGDHALLPTMALSQAVSGYVTVVMTGDGGDETFAGYPSPLIGRLAQPYMRLLPSRARSWLPNLLQSGVASSLMPNRLPRRLMRLAAPTRTDRVRWHYDPLGEKGFRGMLGDILTANWQQQLSPPDVDDVWDAALAESDGKTLADRILSTEILTLLPDQFLVKTDRATMASSLEARSPLLDSDLVDLAARIPIHRKMRRLTLKALLRHVAKRHVPLDVLSRPKHGFSVPTSHWMRSVLAPVARHILLSETCTQRGVLQPVMVRRLLEDHIAGRADHGQRLWVLLQLELWFLMFIDGELQATDLLDIGGYR